MTEPENPLEGSYRLGSLLPRAVVFLVTETLLTSHPVSGEKVNAVDGLYAIANAISGLAAAVREHTAMRGDA